MCVYLTRISDHTESGYLYFLSCLLLLDPSPRSEWPGQVEPGIYLTALVGDILTFRSKWPKKAIVFVSGSCVWSSPEGMQRLETNWVSGSCVCTSPEGTHRLETHCGSAFFLLPVLSELLPSGLHAVSPRSTWLWWVLRQPWPLGNRKSLAAHKPAST